MYKHYLLISLTFFLLVSCSEQTTKNNDILPVINSITITYFPGAQGKVYRGDIGIELECDSYDEDGFIADYLWETTGGVILGAANHARWDAPAGRPGKYYIICTVKDDDDNLARESYEIDVLNKAPTISRMIVFQTENLHQPNFKPNDIGYFYASGFDPEHDVIEYQFIFPDTVFDWRNANNVVWKANGQLPYANKVYGLVRDEFGATSNKDSIEIFISIFNP